MASFRSCMMVFILCFLTGYGLSAKAAPIDEIVVFGDSLSDNGNLYTFTKHAHSIVPSIPVMPKTPPYYQGRFTNGLNWVDDLGAAYHVKVDDYAYGGSWAEPILDSKINIPFGLDMQMDDYLLRHIMDTHRDQHLFVIWSGSNDYAHGRDDADYATTNAVESIRRQIATLIYYGAKNIFVVGVPDLSLVPEVRQEGPEAVFAAHEITNMHNQKLAIMIKNIQKINPGANVILYDITTDFNDIYNHPDKYNIKITLSACYNGGYYMGLAASAHSEEIESAKAAHLDLLNNPSLHVAYMTGLAASLDESLCKNPDDYLFFDTIHPTHYVHQLIAQKALAYLEARGVDVNPGAITSIQ